jgi:DNA-binding FrmR family transcriptional regulator
LKAILILIEDIYIIDYTKKSLYYIHIPVRVCERMEKYMKQCMDSENLHKRLKKIMGQIQAIDRMIDEDVPCEDILSQMNAAKSAIHKCGQIVLEGHIKHCVKDGIEHGDADKTIEEFTKAVERFANMG